MITRRYFIRSKIQHNNGSGKYSWWSGIMKTKSWRSISDNDLFDAAIKLSLENIKPQLDMYGINNSNVEIISMNRI